MAARQYPGVNIPIPHRPGHCWPRRHVNLYYPYGDALDIEGVQSGILQIRELAMMIMMDTLTDKPDWHQKVFDATIVEKWRAEAMEQPQEGLFASIMKGKESEKIPLPRCRIISEDAFEYAIEELRVKARYFEQTKLIPTLDSDGNTIVKSDSLIPQDLHKDIVGAFEKLRHDQASNIDWHPGSNDMVQDLVHPSMYPFVYGRSNFMQEEAVGVADALSFVGQGVAIPEALFKQPSSLYSFYGQALQHYASSTSRNFQWLPSNVSFRDDGRANFTSYINNLHPTKYSVVYSTIERLIDKVLPAWDQFLVECTNVGAIQIPSRNIPGRNSRRFTPVARADDDDETIWEDYDLEYWRNSDLKLPDNHLRSSNNYPRFEEIEQGRIADSIRAKSGETEGLLCVAPHVTEDDIAREKFLHYRDPKYPEPPRFEPVDYVPKQRLRDKFRTEGLQIIVKMASIELTPEKPEFPGGGWHIEGQLNERICATALFYADCQNVTPSRLSFRMETLGDAYGGTEDLEQDAYSWLERVHGTSLGAAGGLAGFLCQNYGDIATQQGRVLAFPNVFQHVVSPFRLQDPTNPGHRRFIALWLVDPHIRVVSTANVPPQQKDWWLDERGGEGGVPDTLMSVEEAKEHRLKLMEERSVKQKDAVQRWEEAEYGFCEH